MYCNTQEILHRVERILEEIYTFPEATEITNMIENGNYSIDEILSTMKKCRNIFKGVA